MENQPNDKPQWLINLEQESWQAELIISGIAIFGSLQLPSLIDRFGQWMITYFTNDMGIFTYFLQFSLYFGASGLIFGFIIHFILRAIWIGFVGLNSAFPNGIKTDVSSYSTHFMENIKRDFSITDESIHNMDKVCSSIFAMCSIMLILTLVFIVDILILYGINLLADSFLPSNLQAIMLVIFYLLIIGIGLLFFILQSKKLRDHANFQRKGYAIYSVFSLIVFHIFRKPYFFLVNTLMSNIDKKKYLGYMVALFIPITGLVMYQFIQSDTIGLLNPQIIFDKYESGNTVLPEVYEQHLIKSTKPIYSAVIESELIEGKMMKLFVPIFNREQLIHEKYCATIQQDSLDKKKLSSSECYNQYHRVHINETVVPTEFVKHYHPHQGTFGVLTYLSTDQLLKGKNSLKVEKLHTDSSGIYRTMTIPFWFAGREE